jgi:replicative DNA helicase
MAMWFETIQKSKLSLLDIKRTMSGFQTMYGNGLRLKSYPAYSANIQTIKRDLEILEITEDFVPDVIIVDYADILSPESSQFEGRDRYDETWKMLKNLAAVKHCLVVTASQSNRKTLDKKDVKASDISEDIRKVAHVDAMFSLSQTPEEKSKGTMRLGVVAHRWRDFNELSHCTVLQQLQTGQVALDSEINREY